MMLSKPEERNQDDIFTGLSISYLPEAPNHTVISSNPVLNNHLVEEGNLIDKLDSTIATAIQNNIAEKDRFQYTLIISLYFNIISAPVVKRRSNNFSALYSAIEVLYYFTSLLLSLIKVRNFEDSNLYPDLPNITHNQLRHTNNNTINRSNGMISENIEMVSMDNSIESFDETSRLIDNNINNNTMFITLMNENTRLAKG